MRRSHYKFLLTDLDGVREKGFEFFEESENWPVKEKEFSEFYNFTRSLYNKIISNVSDTEISDIALVENIFIHNIYIECPHIKAKIIRLLLLNTFWKIKVPM